MSNSETEQNLKGKFIMKNDVMLRLNWEKHGSEKWGANPALPIYRCELGKDSHGVLWLCEAKYSVTRHSFVVLFDTETYEDGSPFLRHSVVYADNFWSAHDKRYRAAYVRYEQMQEVIKKFIIDNGIEAYDTYNRRIIA